MYSVVSSEGNLYVGLLEKISDENSFFSNVRVSRPLWCWGLCACSRYLFLLVSGGGCGVGGWIGKTLLYKMFWMVVTSAL